MDFLDPRTKPARRRRLIISYVLMAILVLTSTFILLYSSLGYGINTKTGQIVQNGLVFVSTKPVAAQISLNDKLTSKHTSARLVLPADRYSLSLSASGYRTWSTSFKLLPQDVWYFQYALLLPQQLQAVSISSSKTAPAFVTQTPDRHFLLIANPSGTSLSISQIDTNNPSASPSIFSLPKSVASFSGGSWQVAGWSSDSSTLLLSHTLGAKSEYLALNRGQPAASINVSKLAKASISKVTFAGNSSNTLFAYQPSGHLLLIDLKAQSASTALSGITSYTSFGPTRVFYAKSAGSSSSVYVWNGTTSYKLASVPASQVYLSAAAYQGNEYYALGYSNSVSVYRNLLNDLHNSPAPKPIQHFKLVGLNNLSFSADSHVLLASATQSYEAYTLDNFQAYNFQVRPKTSANLSWLDNFHLGGLTASGKALISDYNGDNQQLLTSSILPNGEFLSADYKSLFVEAKAKSGVSLQSISLLLPKS